MKAFLSRMSASPQDTPKYHCCSQSERSISGVLDTPHFTHTDLLSQKNKTELFSASGQGSGAAKLLLNIHRHEFESSPRARDPGDLSEIVPETVSGKDRAFQEYPTDTAASVLPMTQWRHPNPGRLQESQLETPISSESSST